MKIKYFIIAVLSFLNAILLAQDTLRFTSSDPSNFERLKNIKQRNGVYKSFYPNGSIKSIEKYKNDKATGTWKWFHENGQLRLKGSYKSYRKTLLDIFVLVFFNPGKDALSYQKNSSYKSGRWKRYYSNGVLEENFNFKNGEENRRCKTYYQNGKLKFFERYKDEEQRVWKAYYESTGKLDFIERYRNLHRVGSWIRYYENGQLEYKLKYNCRGTETGRWKGYYENGNLEYVMKYNLRGKAIGNWKFYYENGQLKKTLNIRKNIKKCFDKNGEKEVCLD